MKGIEGFFSEDEGRWYARFARALAGGVFVEVGSWKGRSTSFVGPVCNANGTRLVCVDHYLGSNDRLKAHYDDVLRGEDVAATFRANMRALGIAAELLVETSERASGRFADGSVDRVFLDASHDEASVARDLALWAPKLREGGVLAGHDYAASKHPGLCKAVDEFARERGLVVERGPRSIYWFGRPRERAISAAPA
ncbi:class I SAM-dependent methyltransferase [bacterium]|nr:MAG: class I SAM-dependent methyltransferase [bacterium]